MSVFGSEALLVGRSIVMHEVSAQKSDDFRKSSESFPGLVSHTAKWSTIRVSPTAPSSDLPNRDLPSSETERTALSRNAIVDAARDMISEIGLDQMSLRRLATQLGVTAPALYAHVTDKSDLLRAIAEEGFQELVARYEVLDASDPLGHVRALTRAYVDQALAEPEIFRLMFLFRPSGIALDVDNVLASASTAFEIPLAAVQTAQAAGRLDPTRDPLLVGLTLWTIAHGAASVVLLGMDFSETGRDELIDSVIDVALRGLAPN